MTVSDSPRPSDGSSPGTVRTEEARVLTDTLASTSLLSSLKGVVERFDNHLGVYGADGLSAALARSLPEQFERDPDLQSRFARELTKIDAHPKPTDDDWRPLVELLATLFGENKVVSAEIHYGLWTAFQTGRAKQLREDGLSGMWRKLDQKSLREAFADVETTFFSRLRGKLRDANPSPRPKSPLPRRPDRGSGSPGQKVWLTLGAGLTVNLSDWEGLQTRLQGIDLDALAPAWRALPRRYLFWLLQNGEPRQFLSALCGQNESIDGELRETFLAMLEADENQLVPMIWKKAAYRSLLRQAAASDGPASA